MSKKQPRPTKGGSYRLKDGKLEQVEGPGLKPANQPQTEGNVTRFRPKPKED